MAMSFAAPELPEFFDDPDDDWPTTLWPAIERWQEIRIGFRQIERITADGQRPVLESFARFVGANRPTAQVRAAHCVRWQAMLVDARNPRGGNYNPTTINRMTSCVRAFFRDEHDLGRITRNPWLRVPTLNVPEARPRALSPDEVKRLLVAADNSGAYAFRNRTLVVLALRTGLRESEIVRLKIDQYDPDRQQLVAVRRSKTQKLEDVFVVDQAERQLQSWIRFGRGGTNTGPLFRSNKTSSHAGHMRPDTLSRVFGGLFKAAGVEGSGHAFRHTFLTDLANSGAPIHVVQKAAGHASMASTQQYVRGTDADVLQAIQGLEPIG